MSAPQRCVVCGAARGSHESTMYYLIPTIPSLRFCVMLTPAMQNCPKWYTNEQSYLSFYHCHVHKVYSSFYFFSTIKKCKSRGFPDSPVVKTPHFHHRGRLDPSDSSVHVAWPKVYKFLRKITFPTEKNAQYKNCRFQFYSGTLLRTTAWEKNLSVARRELLQRGRGRRQFIYDFLLGNTWSQAHK